MPVVLIATPGAADANTYCTLAEANTYHESHVSGATWSGATEANRNIALAQATRMLDAMIEWKGWVVTETQALLWPQNGQYSRNGYTIATTVIPQELKHATAELARQLLAGDRAADNKVEAQGVTRMVAGPIEFEFKGAQVPKVVPDAVFYMVSQWGTVRHRGGAVRELVRA